MMPLFKVRSVSQGSKITVVAENMEKLKHVAQTKFQLAGSVASCMVFDDSDGTLIDDDDCLGALLSFANGKGEHLSVAIVQQGEEWRPFSLEAVSSISGSDTSSLGSVRDPVEDMSNVSLSHTTDFGATVLPALPYQEMTKKLKHALKSPSHIRNQALSRARRSVVKTLTDRLKNRTLIPGTLSKVCNKIHKECPEAFLVPLKEDIKVSCLHQFSRSLYNALGYAKEVEGIRRRQRRSTRRSSESEDVDNPDDQLPFVQLDTNGCSEGMWSPPLSEDLLDELEGKRRTLFDLASQPCQDDAFAHSLLKSTYALQRHCINGARTFAQWRDLVEKWPILKQQSFLLSHANMLLGKEVRTVWNSEMSSSDQVFNFFTEYAERNSRAQKMRMCLQAAHEAVQSFDSALPRRLALLPLIALYLGDAEKEFFLVVRDTLTSMEEIQAKASAVSKCPILVVNGLSIFDAEARSLVVVRGDLVIEANDILDGALLVVLCYFIFNVQYPKGLARTLEFLQRFFLNINPPTPRRINAKVSSLASALADFEARTSRFTMSA